MKVPELVKTGILIEKYRKVVLKRSFRLPNGKIIDFLVWGGGSSTKGAKPNIIFSIISVIGEFLKSLAFFSIRIKKGVKIRPIVPSIVFPITEKGEVIAVKQFRYGANRLILELPGGCPENNESFEETAKKELLQETGYQAEEIIRLSKPLWFEPTACLNPYMPLLAINCKKIKELQLDETEILEVSVIPLEKWFSKIFSGEISDSKSIATTLLALPHFDELPFNNIHLTYHF